MPDQWVALVVDNGMWMDPAVFGPFSSEQEAQAAGDKHAEDTGCHDIEVVVKQLEMPDA